MKKNISTSNYETIFELLADFDNSVIFKINGIEDQLNKKIEILYSRFENLGLYDINTISDLFLYIDEKSEIPEVYGLEKYKKLLIEDFTSEKHLSKQYIPLKINDKTHVFNFKALRLVPQNACYYYLTKVDVSLVDLEKLYQDSYKDRLTNLFNRNALNLHTSSTDKHFFGFFDLDGFKLINDKYSHSEGDELLKIIGDKLIEISDNTVVYYRYGGDEFVFMTIGLNKEQTDELVKKIRSTINSISFHNEKIELSLGYMLYDENCNFDQKTAIEIADLGMYHSKATGKNKITFVDEKWIKVILENDLEEEIKKYRTLTRRD